MNERQRLAYMQAMGVDCYMPRLHLPGALLSRLCATADLQELQPAAESAAALAPVPGQAKTPAVSQPTEPGQRSGGRVAAALALFDQEPQSVTKESIDQVIGTVVTNASLKSPVAEFALSIIRANDVLLVDEGLPIHIDPSEYLQLLQNILIAVGAGRQHLSIDVFKWPMSRSNQVDQGDMAARQTLHAFLAKQVEQLNTRYILVLGGLAAKYLSAESLPRGELILHSGLSTQLLHSCSVLPLLSKPALKRELWRDLQPLYHQLKNG